MGEGPGWAFMTKFLQHIGHINICLKYGVYEQRFGVEKAFGFTGKVFFFFLREVALTYQNKC